MYANIDVYSFIYIHIKTHMILCTYKDLYHRLPCSEFPPSNGMVTQTSYYGSSGATLFTSKDPKPFAMEATPSQCGPFETDSPDQSLPPSAGRPGTPIKHPFCNSIYCLVHELYSSTSSLHTTAACFAYYLRTYIVLI